MNEGATNKFTVVLFTTDGFVWIYDHETQEEAVEFYSVLETAETTKRVFYAWPSGKVVFDSDYGNTSE